jgi:subtilisin family serine protease
VAVVAALVFLLVVLPPSVARAVVTGTVVEAGKTIPDAVVRLDPETPPPPVTAAHDRAQDPNPRAGEIPVVVRTGTNGSFQVEPRSGWHGSLVVSVAHERFRSPDMPTGRDSALGEVKLEGGRQCIRVSVDGGRQWVCERDQWRYAQPAALVAQARTPAAGRADADPIHTQWAMKTIGLAPSSAGAPLTPVIVAVIDSGLDYAHPHLKPDNIWRQTGSAEARYPDAVIGWNFVAESNEPWDDYGHGTFVAGLIVAINPAARIMPLKVLDKFGGGRVSAISEALVYAVDHGARVVNLSLGSAGLTQVEQAAVDYARSKGVLVVTAAGNQGVDTAGFGPAGLRGVMTVAATDANDKKPPFGNWGQQVAISAPAVDVISLRARGSDLILATTGGKDYVAGSNVLGADGWFFKATGTSFATPLVAGAASLLLSRRPTLTTEQVERMLVESADDVEVPGWDQFTGAGRLNVARALQADPDYFLTAKISRIAAASVEGRTVINVFGAVGGSRLERYEIQLGQGATPSTWKTVASVQAAPATGDLLGSIPSREIHSKGTWTIRLVAQDAAKKTKESRASLTVR